MSASRTSFPGRQVDDDKVPSADSTDYFDCRNQPGLGSQRLSGQNFGEGCESHLSHLMS